MQFKLRAVQTQIFVIYSHACNQWLSQDVAINNSQRTLLVDPRLGVGGGLSVGSSIQASLILPPISKVSSKGGVPFFRTSMGKSMFGHTPLGWLRSPSAVPFFTKQ